MARPIERTVKASVGVLSVTLVELPPLLVENAIPVGILLAVGICLRELRLAIIALAPDLAVHATAWAHGFNAIGEVTAVLFDVIEGVILVLYDIASIFTGRIPSFPHFFWPRKITTYAVQELAQDLSRCACWSARNSVEYVFARWASPEVCPLRLMAYPIRILNTTMVPALSFLSFDADPMEGRCLYDTVGAAQERHAECPAMVQRGSDRGGFEYVGNPLLCSGLQVGGILLEYGIPLMVVVLIVAMALGPILYLASNLLALMASVPTTIVKVL